MANSAAHHHQQHRRHSSSSYYSSSSPILRDEVTSPRPTYRDPNYEYYQPSSISSSSASSRPCPYCSASHTTHHVDVASGDLTCTSCGIVLDEKIRDVSAEWRDYSYAGGDTDDGAGLRRARCGDSHVDETKYYGGLMPTRVSSHIYEGSNGGRVGERTSEERLRLALVRGRLKRTHNMIEHMLEKERKEKEKEEIIEFRAMDAMYNRGEVDVNDDRQLHRGGEREAFPPWRSSSPSESSLTKKRAKICDEKWSLADAVLLHGTLDQVRRIIPNPSSCSYDVEWTDTDLEAERADCLRRRRAGGEKKSSSSTALISQLYVTYDILERAAQVLDLGPALNCAVSWLVQYASINEGVKVRGISSSGCGIVVPPVDGNEGNGATLSLSLLGTDRTTEYLALSSSPRTKSASSLLTELHRLRQYAALGSALLYMAAKRGGIGRTLTEVCSAFGTYAVIDPTFINSSGNGVIDGEPLVRPKHCSRAMQELKTALPEDMSAFVQLRDEGRDELLPPVKVTPTHDGSTSPVKSEYHSGSSTTLASGLAPSIIKSNHIPDATVATAEEAALSNLTTRIANVLNLPQCAVSAAAAIAVQCVRDARASFASIPTRHKGTTKEKVHIRPNKRRRRGDNVLPRRGKGDTPDDVVAIASILLVCTAGGTMQILARQALKSTASSSTISASITRLDPDPLDHLTDNLLTSGSSATSHHEEAVDTSSNNNTKKQQVEILSSWQAWNDQPSWHRNVAQMERSTAIPRKAIISYYSSALHPRRFYYLGVAGKSVALDGTVAATAGLLLSSIVSAVPLMSLRNL
jgi:transcription initiation factor TFIIIB Brf1 subunit/transcription initiation factor TFIIB